MAVATSIGSNIRSLINGTRESAKPTRTRGFLRARGVVTVVHTTNDTVGNMFEVVGLEGEQNYPPAQRVYVNLSTRRQMY